MSEYSKTRQTTPLAADPTTEADRMNSDREVWTRLEELEGEIDNINGRPFVPELPTTAGAYNLTVQVTDSAVSYAWTAVSEEEK